MLASSMHIVDWLVMIVPILACACIAIYTRRYVRSVADFMAGGRNAGRFLICTAKSEQGSGAVVYVAMFQVFLASGFTLGWFGQIATPIGLLVMICGFVIYRYRQTRAMTLGQFFEMRYSRNFRLFAGVLGFFAGLVNFGVIPVIGAQFMVYFLQLPLAVEVGGMVVPTHLILMGIFLTACVIMTTTGGQVSVLLTDCAEGMISQLFYTIIAVTLIIIFFDWAKTHEVLLDAVPGKSLVNPFDTKNAKDFNIWYVLIGIFLGNYRTLAWQNSHAFNSSAATPHEARMGGVLGRWRNFASGVMVTLLGVCAMVYLHSSPGKELAAAALNQIADPATRDQMQAPVALTLLLPVGIKGALLSICLMGIIAGDGIHLHSWGSIFIQDVVAPLRKQPSKLQTWMIFTIFQVLWVVAGGLFYYAILKSRYHLQAAGLGKMAYYGFMISWFVIGCLAFLPFGKLISSSRPLTPTQHIRLLRLAIVGVAAWAFFFGAFFPQIKYVAMWWSVTEAIFVSGAGIAIIGGLYWARGTTAGAWVGLPVGSILATGGIGLELFVERAAATTWPWLHHLLQSVGLEHIDKAGKAEFYFNGTQIAFFSTGAAVVSYMIVSLLTCRNPHNMDKLLHRGQYAVASDNVDKPTGPKRSWLYRIVMFGIDEQFSKADRWITVSITIWSMFWFTLFAVGSIVYLFKPWSDEVWAGYWLITGIYLPLLIGAATTIWFTWGCTKDMIVFFRRLNEERVDVHDDGTVVHGEEQEGEAQALPVGAAVEGDKVASK